MISNLGFFNNFQSLNNVMPQNFNNQANGFNSNNFYNPFNTSLNSFNGATAQQPSFNFFTMFMNLMFQMMQNFFNPVKNQPVALNNAPQNNAELQNQNVNNAPKNNAMLQNQNVSNTPQKQTLNTVPKQQTVLLSNNANGTVLGDFNFEDGEVPVGAPWDSANKAKIPPQVLQDHDGRKFIRMTVAGADKMYIPDEYQDRTRVLKCLLTNKPYQEGKKISYSTDVRFNDNFQGVFFSFYQTSNKVPKITKYGEKSAEGQVAAFHRNPDGTTEIYRVNMYDIESKDAYAKSERINLGHIGEGKFTNIKLETVWSNDPKKGEMIVYVDGKEAGRMTGATSLHPLSTTLPRVVIGAYGDNGKNQVAVDFDNVKFIEMN